MSDETDTGMPRFRREMAKIWNPLSAEDRSEIITALEAAERGLDEIDDLPFGTVGKALDAIMRHVQTALHAAQTEKSE